MRGKSEDRYKYSITELMKTFPGVTKCQVEKARKHANLALAGIPIEPGKYHRSRVSEAEINLFLDFIQFGGLVQDVASGTRSVKLSSNKIVVMPNVVRTVHKAEIIRLYEVTCDQINHTKKNWVVINKDSVEYTSKLPSKSEKESLRIG